MSILGNTIARRDSDRAALDAFVARREGAHVEAVQIEMTNPPENQAVAVEDTPQAAAPKLNDLALYGLVGEIVRAIEPHTESDPAAILIQVLTAFGVLVGAAPFYQVEGDKHHARQFVVLVGDTAKGRKGTSLGRVRSIFQGVAAFPPEVSGLVSGEGFKWQVRDAVQKAERDKESGNVRMVEVDPGVVDKRLLVVEPELAQILRVIGRQGNTLSSDIRNAWDTGNLSSLSKNSPITATGAHIGIVAHVTADELRAELSQTDTANGLANRFLFVCVRRSKCLPFGGDDLDPKILHDFAQRLARAAGTARTHGRVQFTERARAVWGRVYPTLSEGHPGLFGAVTGRAEAQTVRLALHYALLDERDAIDAEHLLAALAVWDYCEASARYIFGSALGDPVADDILRALHVHGSSGMSRTDIRDLFRRHQSAERIGVALDLLARRGLATVETVSTAGRPVEQWRSATKATKATKGG